MANVLISSQGKKMSSKNVHWALVHHCAVFLDVKEHLEDKDADTNKQEKTKPKMDRET